MIFKRIIWLWVIFCTWDAGAQDIQFSQFYSALLYQNPAFAGSSHHHRGSFHQRVQWPGINAKYVTSMLTYDTYFNKYNSGFGLMVSKDWQGSSNLNSLDVGLIYSYELHLTDGLTFRPGLQISAVNRSVGYSLTLPQDFDNNGQLGTSFSAGNKALYADVSTGGILYSNNIWFGVSAHHLNRPNQSFIDGVSRLPTKIAFTGGYKILLKKSPYHHVGYLDHDKEYSITPTFHYKFQGKADQLDVGVYGVYDFLTAGIWYRGIPVKYYRPDFKNSESMILMIGYKFEKQFSVTYSYDFTLSGLTKVGAGGSHELNLTYLYKRKKHYKPMKRLPCPSFHHR